MRWWHLPSAAMTAIAALLFAVSGCQPVNEFKPPPPPQVTVALPVEQSVADEMQFTGSTRATATVDLRSRVNGYLRSIEFEDGAMVQQGDLLFVIEQDPYETALSSAQADRQKAQAALQLAEVNLGRTQELIRRNATSRQELDVQKAELATAKADIAAAEAAIEQAELNLKYTEIRAPITGRIGRRMIDEGNLVQSEQTLLATIESIDPIYVEFYVGENDLLRLMDMVQQDELPDPEQNPPELVLSLSDDGPVLQQGRLDFQATSVDPSTGTILRRGIFDNPTGQLLPGMFVRIRAPLGEPKPKLLVEERALAADQRGDYLLVVNEENVVEYRPVTLGIAQDGLRVVEEGVSERDWVIVNGLQRARPGSPVDPQRPEAETQTADSKSNPEEPVVAQQQ